ncbi:MAG: hypothetical protein ABIF88_02795 [archaeon]
MIEIDWTIPSILALLIITAFLVFYATRNKKQKINYRSLFLVGVVWIAIGIPLKNYIISLIGIAFMLAGIKNKKELESKKHKSEKELTSKKKKIYIFWMILLTLVLISGIVTYILLQLKIK